MNTIRKLLCWLFAISSLLCLWNALLLILRIVHRHYAFLPGRGALAIAFFPVLAIVFAAAWWTVWKRKPSARGWGIAACLTYVLVSAWGIFSSRSVPVSLGVMLAVGVAGLFVLLWPVHDEASEDDPSLL